MAFLEETDKFFQDFCREEVVFSGFFKRRIFEKSGVCRRIFENVKTDCFIVIKKNFSPVKKLHEGVEGEHVDAETREPLLAVGVWHDAILDEVGGHFRVELLQQGLEHKGITAKVDGLSLPVA